MLDLDRMAEQAEPRARKDFLGVWGTLANYATLDLLTRALAERRSNLIQQTLPWQGLKNALYAEYRRLLLSLFEKGGEAQFKAIVGKIDRPTAFNIQHPEAERWARTYAGQLVDGLTRQTQQALADAIAEMIRLQIPPEQGARMLRQMLGLTKPSVQAVLRFQQGLKAKGYSDAYVERLTNEYSRRHLNHRARVVARTETLRAMQEGQRQSFTQAVEQGVLIRDRTRRQWVTAADERVCFRAGTGILTDRGEVPIERIQVGDVVVSHKGPRKVTATRSAYASKPIVAVRAGERTTYCTTDHPFVCLRSGAALWVEAGKLREGDYLLQSRPDGLLGPKALYVGLCDAHDAPTVLAEKPILAGVPGFVAVPVCSVHFERHAVVGQGEVDGIAPHPHLLGESKPHSGQGFPRSSLQPRFAFAATPTGDGAEPGRTTGDHAEIDGAGLTNHNARGATTLLGAEAVVVALDPEPLVAPLAIPVLGDGQSASAGADREPIRDGRGNGEALVASGAAFGRRHKRLGRQVTRPTTEPRSLDGPAKLRPAVVAGAFVPTHDRGGVVAGTPTELGGGFGVVGDWVAATDATSLGGSHTVIYDLQVEDASTFIANGLLVHNCEICAPMDGQLTTLTEPWQTSEGPVQTPTDSHPQCRCAVVLVFPDAQGQFPTRSPRGTDTGQPLTPRTLRPKVRREP